MKPGLTARIEMDTVERRTSASPRRSEKSQKAAKAGSEGWAKAGPEAPEAEVVMRAPRRRSNRLLVVAICLSAVLGFSVPRASARPEVIAEEITFIVSSSCFDEAVVATGTAHIVTSDVAIVVTIGHVIAVGSNSGETFRVAFGFSATFPPQEFIANTMDRLVIVDPDGNRQISHVTTHVSFVNGHVRIDIEHHTDRCVQL
jgi:hypothetical protein